MKLSSLPPTVLSDRLRTDGLRLNIGPFTFCFGTALPELVAPIQLLYADHQLAAEECLVDFDVRVDFDRFAGLPSRKRARFVLDGQPRFEPFARGIVLPMFEWGVNWCTFTGPQQYFMLHTAVVEKNGRALLLPGPPGAGKSTLCAALVLRGWRLLSDELALMRPGSIDLIAVPRPIGLKEESIQVIARFEPQAILGPPCSGTRKGTVAHLKPPAESVERAGEKAQPQWIAFPTWRAGQEVIAEPASKAQTFMWLAQDAFNFNILGEPAFVSLADLVETCDCLELGYGDLEQAVHYLDGLAAHG